MIRNCQSFNSLDSFEPFGSNKNSKLWLVETNTQPRFSCLSPPVGYTQTVGSWGGNLSIHLGFYLQLPSRPISLSLSHCWAMKSTRVRFRPPAICLCQAFISSLVPPFGNSKGELNTVYRPHLSALPSSTFLSFLGLLFNVKSDSNIYSSVNQRRCSACFFFPPFLCTNLILFPETLCQSKEKTLFLSFFIHVSSEKEKCKMQ